MSLMEEVSNEIAKLDENAIRERLAKINEQRERQKSRQREKLANLTPEEKEARKAKQAEYRAKNKEKFLEARREYNSRPEVKARRAAYMKRRNAERAALLKRAKELGITA